MLEHLPERSGRKGKKLAQVARLWARDLLHIPTQGAGNDPQADFDEALAALGLVDEGAADGQTPPEEKCYLWPCNVRTFDVWMQIQTQWRTSSGMDGSQRTGLDYSAVSCYLYDTESPRYLRRNWKEIWGGLQAMEIASLLVWEQMRQEKR